MKVTFKRRNLAMTVNCDFMCKLENRILTSFNLKTTEMGMVEMFQEELEEADKVLIFEDDDGVEFSVLTTTIEKHENYAIIRLNLN